ncbi:hypothetical protein EVAR_22062_1 [Eumeta japonica]|uniref:Uncharacterized protein n=1 Tax=Eumeta variegata TaxID=151549 RepID=A0A4C1UT96_EUMVA|nr:hypothetical protein EVAR_22062_1 [Eumeta japonica]
MLIDKCRVAEYSFVQIGANIATSIAVSSLSGRLGASALPTTFDYHTSARVQDSMTSIASSENNMMSAHASSLFLYSYTKRKDLVVLNMHFVKNMGIKSKGVKLAAHKFPANIT